MMPEVILFVLSFPGRKAVRFEENRLPGVGVLTGMECSAAETTIQKELVASMQQTLRTAEIGMRDDFFVLDGQSLKAVELISESTRDTALTGTCEFYKEPTVECLERLLTRNRNWAQACTSSA